VLVFLDVLDTSPVRCEVIYPSNYWSSNLVFEGLILQIQLIYPFTKVLVLGV
jgi:hypothetical protein